MKREDRLCVEDGKCHKNSYFLHLRIVVCFIFEENSVQIRLLGKSTALWWWSIVCSITWGESPPRGTLGVLQVGVVWTGLHSTGPHTTFTQTKKHYKIISTFTQPYSISVRWFWVTIILLLSVKQVLVFPDMHSATVTFEFVGPWDGGGYRQGQRNCSDRRDLEDRHHGL